MSAEAARSLSFMLCLAEKGSAFSIDVLSNSIIETQSNHYRPHRKSGRVLDHDFACPGNGHPGGQAAYRDP